MNVMDVQQCVDGRIRELALFAGAGGGILGSTLLGWRTVCAVERDAYPAQVLAQRQNDGILEPFPIWSDVQTFDGTAWRGCIDVYREDFRVRHSAMPQPVKTLHQKISGNICGESLAKSNQSLCSEKTSHKKPSIQHVTTSSRWATKPRYYPLARKTWLQTITDQDIGYLHTPTTQGNYCADSMQKHQCCRNYKMVFGQATPESQEFLMEWPVSWTELKPLGMDKFLLWLRAH